MSKKIDQDTRDIILTNLGSSLTILLFGFLVAYLLKRNADEYDWIIFWFTVLIALIISVIYFFVKCKKQRQLYDKRNAQKENNNDINKE